ncbi:haloalkane dehalogenase [Burkholderia multivorans]|uniref:haloalkane dehalogenase n=1 Tax=Burkholderia multivorans TaxID=87883 RepID=UPI001C220D02|nr:haloalkane dehalogenase [Burkholderia multivorans]MBU9610620.1 haloalkane dehalogenase [Burkholderia multivorans]
MSSTERYGDLKYREIHGIRMAYVDEGEGDTIVFQHGQPTSSYVWRNVMPHLQDMGRLVACDLIGMGASDKLVDSGPGSYSYAQHRDYLFALWDALDLGNNLILVLDDWGATLGFDWANRYRDRVKGIVHMEAVALPMNWSDIPEPAHPFFQALRSPAGEDLVLQQNIFIEQRLQPAVLRQLDPREMDEYRKPYQEPGEGRRPTLSWPRSLPLDGDLTDVRQAMDAYVPWVASGAVPKLLINGDPGAIMTGRIRDEVRAWQNQQEVTVKGRKILQEDSPDEIGAAIAGFVQRVRAGVAG